MFNFGIQMFKFMVQMFNVGVQVFNFCDQVFNLFGIKCSISVSKCAAACRNPRRHVILVNLIRREMRPKIPEQLLQPKDMRLSEHVFARVAARGRPAARARPYERVRQCCLPTASTFAGRPLRKGVWLGHGGMVGWWEVGWWAIKWGLRPRHAAC